MNVTDVNNRVSAIDDERIAKIEKEIEKLKRDKITSNVYTAPTPNITQSSELNSNFAGYKAFNNVQVDISSLNNAWLSTAEDTSPWLAYEFDKLVHFEKIDIEYANNSDTVTHTFKIQGSKDGIDYVDLETITLEFERSVIKTDIIPIESDETYKFLRIQGSEPNYGGVNLYACAFSQVTIYATVD